MSQTTAAQEPVAAESARGGKEAALELKGSVFTLPVLLLRTPNLKAIDSELARALARAPGFFKDAPVVLQLHAIKDRASELNLAALIGLLRNHKLVPVGLLAGAGVAEDAALAAGLALLRGANAGAAGGRSVATGVGATGEPGAAPAPRPAAPPSNAAPSAARLVHQTVRSGQRIAVRGGDLIVTGMVNSGAEIMADGNIHVYGALRGRALAGIHGDAGTRIFCQSLEAELVAIAGHYRVFEEQVPAQFHRRAVQIYLDNEQLVIEPLGAA